MATIFFTGWLNKQMMRRKSFEIWSKAIYEANQNDMALIVFKIPNTRAAETISLIEETIQNHFFQQYKISQNEKEDK